MPHLDFSRGNRCFFDLYTRAEGPKRVVSELGFCQWAVSLSPPAPLGNFWLQRGP